MTLQLFSFQKFFFFVNVDDETSLVVTMVDIFPFALILGLLANQ